MCSKHFLGAFQLFCIVETAAAATRGSQSADLASCGSWKPWCVRFIICGAAAQHLAALH